MAIIVGSHFNAGMFSVLIRTASYFSRETCCGTAEIGSNIHLFSDDTSLYITVANPITSAVCTQSYSSLTFWLSLRFALFQAINEPTHFTETSCSLLDILLISNNSHLKSYYICRMP